jgi:hypothetical protein
LQVDITVSDENATLLFSAEACGTMY